MKATHQQLIVLKPTRDLLPLEDVASRSGVHPELVHRFIDLGLIEPVETPSTAVMLEPEAVHRIRVIERLRCDLGINLQGIGVILELLDRLSAFERGGQRGY